MFARGDFGNDTPKGPMRFVLPGDTMRKYCPFAAHKRGRRFVAARFNAQDQRHRLPSSRPRR